MDKYIVVTLGPIFDTVNLASSPAALWTGSYMFSYLNKTICRLLIERGVPEEDILTPFYSAGSGFAGNCDGVGLFHDRIVFKAGAFQFAEFAQVREAAIDHLSETFSVDRTYLKEYLLIAGAVCEAENPIMDTGKILDCLELAKPIVKPRQDNPLLAMLVGEKYYGNEAIKELPLTKQFQNWQLRKPNGQLKSISDIAGVPWKTDLKKHQYYAVVRADGDHMGDIIASLDSGSIRSFSEDCIHYCSDIAKAVGNFGGVTIYSGGDDLLAILPCENQRGQSVFEFVRQANALFDQSFSKEKYHKDVSLSFGVTICYHKFPLYEALEDSQHMLFDLAKSKRNCMAVHLQKHAGQSEGLIIPNGALDALIDLYNSCVSRKDTEWLHSIHHKLKTFRKLFLLAEQDWDRIHNLFENVFDAECHVDNDLLQRQLPKFYYDMMTRYAIDSVADEIGVKYGRNPEQDPVDTLCYILRLFKFFVEKGGKEE